MNQREFDALKAQLERARDEAIELAEMRYQDALTALLKVYDATSNVGNGSGRGRGRVGRPAGVRQSSGRGRKGTLIDSMREAVAKQSGNFTIADVKDILAKKNPSMVRDTNPAVFSTTIKRLEQLGEIKLVKRGKGRRASIYKR